MLCAVHLREVRTTPTVIFRDLISKAEAINRNRQSTKTLKIGLGISLASLLLSAIFIPFLALSVSALITTAVLLSARAGQVTKRWALTWAVGIGAVAWIAGAIYAIASWGEAFTLSDNSQPVPMILKAAQAISTGSSLAGFTVLVTALVLSTISLRKLHTIPVRG